MIRPPPRSPLFPNTPLSRSPPAAKPPDSSGGPIKIKFEDAMDKAGLLKDFQAGKPLAPRRGYGVALLALAAADRRVIDRKSTRLNSSHSQISYAVFCLKKKR